MIFIPYECTISHMKGILLAFAALAAVSGAYYLMANKDLANKVYEEFKEEHGEKAVPITYYWEGNNIPQTYKTVSIPSALKKVITSSDNYEEPKKEMRIE